MDTESLDDGNSGVPSSTDDEDDDEDENSSDEYSDPDDVPDLTEKLKYKARDMERRSQKNRDRHDCSRLQKLAKPRPQCSQYEQLTIAVYDFVKMIFGVVRKRRGQQQQQYLPEPPTEQEYLAWMQRKAERRRIVDESAETARSRYLRKHPLASSKQVAIVEKHAVEMALSKIKPVPFSSRFIDRDPALKYPATAASVCEGGLAIAGFPRGTADWYSSFKSSWNEAFFAIMLQEFEKCYKRGDADKYNIEINQVTQQNMREALERWFTNKAREYAVQAKEKEQEDLEALINKKQLQKERSARKRSQRRVSTLVFGL